MVLAGVATLGLEIFYWLRRGTFAATKTWFIADLTCCTAFYHWLVSPDDWLGVHRIASFLLDIPLFLSLIVCGLLASAVGHSSATEDLDKRIYQLKNGPEAGCGGTR